MESELKRNISEIDILISKLGDSPEWKVNSYKTILQGCRERKDKDGVKVWEKKVSDAEIRAIEFRKLNKKIAVFKDALKTLTDSKHPDFQRVELSLLDIIRAADAAYKNDVTPVHFDEVIREEPYTRQDFNRMQSLPLRLWRQGRMSKIMGGV